MVKNNIAVTETYLDVELLIYKTCHDFVRQYGEPIPLDDMIGEANLVYLKVYDIYDPSKGALSTVLVASIWRRLIDMMRKVSEDRKVGRVSLDADNGGGTLAEMVKSKEDLSFNLAEFASDLSSDAHEVLRLVFESPKEVTEAAMGKGDEPRNWRSTIREYLYNLGWSATRVADTFNEIKGALA